MIDSGIYTKSTIFAYGEIQTEDLSLDTPSAIVNKSSMYHLISAHISQIFKDDKIEPILKQKFVYQFGYKMGYNLAEQQCYGYAKYAVSNPAPQKSQTKKDQKQFVGQMKILNGKLWPALVGNKCKLYAINVQPQKGASYKIQDKQFSLGKSVRKPSTEQQKKFRKILLQFSNGFTRGCLHKFNIQGDINCQEGLEGGINAQFRGLRRKGFNNAYNEYSQTVIKDAFMD